MGTFGCSPGNKSFPLLRTNQNKSSADSDKPWGFTTSGGIHHSSCMAAVSSRASSQKTSEERCKVSWSRAESSDLLFTKLVFFFSCDVEIIVLMCGEKKNSAEKNESIAENMTKYLCIYTAMRQGRTFHLMLLLK